MRLIDGDALEKAISVSHSMTDDYGVQTGYAISMRLIEDAPTIDPVRKGKWIKISPAGIYECSECGQNVMTSDIDVYRWCHGCGAKMEEQEDIPMEYFESGGR